MASHPPPVAAIVGRWWWWVPGAVFGAGLVLLCWAALAPDRVRELTPPFAAFAAASDWRVLGWQVLMAAIAWHLYRRPRRGDHTSTIPAVLTLTGVAFVLSFAAYLPCSGAEAPFWTPLYRAVAVMVGSVAEPFGTDQSCAPVAPLALQLGRLAGVSALVVGVAGGFRLLFRNRFDQLRAQRTRSLAIVTGVGRDAAPLLRQIAEELPSGRRLVIVAPTADRRSYQHVPHSLILDETPGAAVATAALVGRRRDHAVVGALYALDSNSSANQAVFEAVRATATGQRRGSVPLAVIRIDDPWEAEHYWRAQVDAQQEWLVDAVGVYEITARILIDRWVSSGVDMVVLVGCSTLALAICNECAQRRRERAASQRATTPFALNLIAVGQTAAAVRHQHILAQRRFGNLAETVRTDPRPAEESVLDEILAAAAHPAVAFVDPPADRSPELSIPALAVAHPDWAIFAFDPSVDGLSTTPSLARLFPFGLSMSTPDRWGLDRWQRAARLFHDNYLVRHPPVVQRAASLPWDEGLPTIYKESNLRLITTTFASAVAIGRSWGPFDPSSGEGVADQLTDGELAEMARREHESWAAHLAAAGWTYGPRDDRRRRHERLLPWDELDDDSRSRSRNSVEDALDVLRALGYRSSRSDNPDWRTYRRSGQVTARVSDVAMSWTTDAGSRLVCAPGDWILTDGSGRQWSIKPGEFAASYRQLDSSTWERIGTVQAYRTTTARTVQTLEGSSTAAPGDWILRSPTGAYWPVPDAVFRATYVAAGGAE